MRMMAEKVPWKRYIVAVGGWWLWWLAVSEVAGRSVWLDTFRDGWTPRLTFFPPCPGILENIKHSLTGSAICWKSTEPRNKNLLKK